MQQPGAESAFYSRHSSPTAAPRTIHFGGRPLKFFARGRPFRPTRVIPCAASLQLPCRRTLHCPRRLFLALRNSCQAPFPSQFLHNLMTAKSIYSWPGFPVYPLRNAMLDLEGQRSAVHRAFSFWEAAVLGLATRANKSRGLSAPRSQLTWKCHAERGRTPESKHPHVASGHRAVRRHFIRASL